jgi:hypothetical protein
MYDLNLERLRAHRKNIDRYRRLLATHLSELERAYVERRLSEKQASVKGLLRETFPDRFTALLSRAGERTPPPEMAALLPPADAYQHPLDVVDDRDLTSWEKRAILSSWAADSCAVRGPSWPARETAVSFDDILDALHLVGSETEPADHSNGAGAYQERDHPGAPSIDF